MIRYHFLRADWTAGEGREPAWTVGETRTVARPERVALCQYGYHFSPTWLEALKYAPGSVACRVEVEPVASDDDWPRKGVSSTRTLVAGKDCARELWAFACDCAERALLRERERGCEPDPRSWAAVEARRGWLRGEVSIAQLAAAACAADSAYASASDSAAYAAASAAYAAAYVADSADSAYDSASDSAAYAAAYAYVAAYVEREWQTERLAWYLDRALDQGVTV